jgi:POT family proton-dependent oligopeptide transporter
MTEKVSNDILGHPRGLPFLFGTEMWERFSYYGMRALLVIYMVHYLLVPGQIETVWGMLALKSALESLFGPLDIIPFSSQIYGLYTGLVYLTPILGGLLADRYLGRRRTVLIGALLMAGGHFLMAIPSLFLPALTLLILGNGAFKPNISSQVGLLYSAGDHRRDKAYSIFYVGINLGAFLAPLICGTLGESVGWHYGFGAAGIGMLIAIAIYLLGVKSLPPDQPASKILKQEELKDSQKPNETRVLIHLLLICVISTFFWATYEQQGNSIALWVDTETNRHISIFGWQAEIPVSWFQAVNPFLIFTMTPLIIGFWRWQERRQREPSTMTKLGLGCLGPAGANFLMALAAWSADSSHQSSSLWVLGYFLILTIGELYFSPVGLSLFSKAAPPKLLSMLMGCWLAGSFIGNFLAGWLGSFWSRMDQVSFFLMIAFISVGSSLMVFILKKLSPQSSEF